jgi:endo-1,4-beta-D-glucanase Y
MMHRQHGEQKPKRANGRSWWLVLLAGLLVGCWNTDPPAGHGAAGAGGENGSSQASTVNAGPSGTTSAVSTGSSQGGGPVGCDGSGDAAHPFGNHAFDYVAGSILPDVASLGALDQAVVDEYEQWKSLYLRAACGGYIVEAAVGAARTVSEAHGYGMMIAAYMAGYDTEAKAIFDGMHSYLLDHPSQGSADLMAWSQDASCNNNQGAQSATDGDLDVAYALLLADKQWGSGGAIHYRAEADRISQAILTHEVDDTNSWFLLGDWAHNSGQYYDATRSSDFMPGHVASFLAADGSKEWKSVLDGGYAIFSAVQSTSASATGLFPDFIRFPASSPAPAGSDFLEGPYDGTYRYNACRVPWRLGVHYLTSGEPRAAALLSKINNWVKTKTAGDPDNIEAGYWLDGDTLPGSSYFSTAFAGPFGVAAMSNGAHQAWLNKIWTALDQRALDGTYYEDTIKLLTMIAMSGNWWAPETAPCP